LIRRRWGLAEAGDTGARCPAVQLIRRGMRPRTKARMDWHGAWLGRCSLTWVFISTTRTASLTRRRRRVSNWAVRQDERRGISVRRLHKSQLLAAARIRVNTATVPLLLLIVC